jgi:hypothetical protein
MLCAVESAAGDFSAADRHLQSLTQLAREQPGQQRERHPEAVALWTAAEHPSLRASAEELAVVLFEDVREEKIVRSERWRRMLTAKRQLLLTPLKQDDQSTAKPTRWIPVTRSTSESRGAGYPHAVWQIHSGSAFHRVGHDHDYLYFQSPLRGQFVVEADSTTFGLQDIQLGFGNHWAGSAWDLTSVVNANFRHDLPALPLDPPLTRMLKSMRVRLEVNEDARLVINGRHVHTRPVPKSSDPWLSIHSWWLAHGTVNNLRITGEPVIPDTVSMITPDLSGWLPYYDQSIGWSDADWSVREVNSAKEAKPQATSIFSSQGLEMVGRLRPNLNGVFSESLIRYHRPMIEDGTIEYEFYYEPGRSLVHPALDRLCLILSPSGIDLHWATDGRHDPTDLEPDNRYHEPQHSREPLHLIPSAWNRAVLSVRGDVVEFSLNGRRTFVRPLEPTNQRTFGLFHWSDQSEVRIRNLKWTGNWPKTLPPLAEQSLADMSLENELGDRNELTSILKHDFRNGIPSHAMSVTGTDGQANATQQADGILIRRPGGHYVNYTLLSPILLSGDFDMIAEFDQFQTEVEAGGEGNIQLATFLDDDYSSECYLFRKHYVFPEGRQEQIAQPAIFQKRGGETQFSFFDAPAEETNAGRLRLVRRGTTLFSLISEGDSENYRLIRREQITQDDARFRLIVGHHKNGFTKVLLKSIDVRAETSWGASSEALKSVAQLDKERSELKEHRTWDFRNLKGEQAVTQSAAWATLGSTVDRYTTEPAGLRIRVPGSEQWSASGLVSRCQIVGDFDIELHLEALFLEPSKQYGESGVLLLTEFRDRRKTTTETKFSIHNAGDRKAETQLRRLRKDGKFDYQELVSQPFDDVAILRLARRGDVVYQIFRSTVQKEPVVLGAMQIGSDPVIPGDLRALVHTAGEGRTSIIRFQKLTIQAEKVIDPE